MFFPLVKINAILRIYGGAVVIAKRTSDIKVSRSPSFLYTVHDRLFKDSLAFGFFGEQNRELEIDKETGTKYIAGSLISRESLVRNFIIEFATLLFSTQLYYSTTQL